MAVTGLGRSETCLTHPDRPAVGRCAACHKPVCSECAVSTKDGRFCSQGCAKRTADFRSARGKVNVGGRKIADAVRLVVWVVVIIAALWAVNRYVYRIPVAGALLDKLTVSASAVKSAP